MNRKTTPDDRRTERPKVITCAICGYIHPDDSECKPWNGPTSREDSHFCESLNGRRPVPKWRCSLCGREGVNE